MTKLNREQIIKALECCSKEWKCGLCGFTEKECALIKQSTLALINSQEQKIKELTAEYDSMANTVNKASELIQKLRAEKKELTEENERLKSVEFTCGFIKPHKVLECPIFDEIERTKADTVQKFAERLKKYYRSFEGKTSTTLTAYHIDQIEQEMLKGDSNDNN